MFSAEQFERARTSISVIYIHTNPVSSIYYNLFTTSRIVLGKYADKSRILKRIFYRTRISLTNFNDINMFNYVTFHN